MGRGRPNGQERSARDSRHRGRRQPRSIRSHVDDFDLTDPVALPEPNRERAQSVKTRLAELDDATQRDLINWGYVIADAALRTWVYRAESVPAQLPAR